MNYSAYFVGRLLASEYDAVSDKREKRVVGHIDPEGALTALSGVEVVKYEWLNQQSLPKWGFLAQQLALNIREAVTVGPGQIDGQPVNDLHTVDGQQVTAIEVSAIQGLDVRTRQDDARLAQLTSANAALRAETQALQERLARLEATVARLRDNGPSR